MSQASQAPVVEMHDIETPVIDRQPSVTKTPQVKPIDYFYGYGFYWKLISNTLFVIGSVLYLVMSVEALDWYKFEGTLPENVKDADDDYTWWLYYNETGRDYWDDDVLFKANNNEGSYVTREMALYFAAALCFFFTGLLDLWRTRHWFNIIMIMAASFGVASSMLVIKDERLAIIFNSVSVHLFALEAVFILCTRHPKSLRIWLYTSDLCFLCGTVMDCVLSYFHVKENFTLRMAKVSIAAACFWLVCSLMYIVATLYLRVLQKKSGLEDDTAHEDKSPEESEENSESDE